MGRGRPGDRAGDDVRGGVPYRRTGAGGVCRRKDGGIHAGGGGYSARLGLSALAPDGRARGLSRSRRGAPAQLISAVQGAGGRGSLGGVVAWFVGEERSPFQL